MEKADEPFFTESRGASAGVNPFFGEWSGVFKFPPVSHTAKFERREEFRLQFQKSIGCRYYFTDEVKVQITLYLNEQRVRETDSTADVDNYAKGILDCLKGQGGVLIDDCQIQSLDICWVSSNTEEEWFDVQIRGHPDEFKLRDVALYEMPNGLWYPLSTFVWVDGEAMPMEDADKIAGPLILEVMTDFTNKIRAKMRNSGMDKITAYRTSNYFNTVARGFHKSRVEGQFDLVPIKKWRLDVDELAKADKGKAQKVYDLLKTFKVQKKQSLEGWKEILDKMNKK